MSGKPITAAVVFAAGKGSRMEGYDGNKTLLPLVPRDSLYQGEHPLLLHILEQLPPGPKAVVVNHRKEDVLRAVHPLGISHCDQPVTNGTGGALLAARPFVSNAGADRVIITMGDVPFVHGTTYESLLSRLDDYPFSVLGFEPEDRKRYGLLQTSGPVVRRIVEWAYWHRLPLPLPDSLRICNAGIYAARVETLRPYLDRLEERPHRVVKDRDGRPEEIREYFITDLVELMAMDGLETGYIVARDETEVMGIDDPQSLRKAQEIFRARAEGIGGLERT